MKVLLLPGLDGTGLLFKKLIEMLPQNLEVEVVSYETIEGLSFIKQAEELASRYYNEELLIVSESYSGRVAYELCHLLKSNVKGIIFLASFVSRPSLFSTLASLIPVRLLAPNCLTVRLLYFFGFSCSGGKTLTDPVFDSLKYANKSKLKSRLRNISNLRNPNLKIICPVIYVRPNKDRLVTQKAVRLLESICGSYTEISVEGGHFIAQANPEVCAKVISNAICVWQGYSRNDCTERRR